MNFGLYTLRKHPWILLLSLTGFFSCTQSTSPVMEEMKEYEESCLVLVSSLNSMTPLENPDKSKEEKEKILFNQFLLQYDWQDLARFIYKQQEGFIFLLPSHDSDREVSTGLYSEARGWCFVSSPHLSLPLLMNNINLLYQLWSEGVIEYQYGSQNAWVWTSKIGRSIILGEDLSHDLIAFDYVKTRSQNTESVSIPLRIEHRKQCIHQPAYSSVGVLYQNSSRALNLLVNDLNDFQARVNWAELTPLYSETWVKFSSPHQNDLRKHEISHDVIYKNHLVLTHEWSLLSKKQFHSMKNKGKLKVVYTAP